MSIIDFIIAYLEDDLSTPKKHGTNSPNRERSWRRRPGAYACSCGDAPCNFCTRRARRARARQRELDRRTTRKP